MMTAKRVLALLGVFTLLAVPARAQDQQGSADEAAMMQAWMAYMTPGEPHQHLAKSAGEWNHTSPCGWLRAPRPRNRPPRRQGK